MQAAVSAAAAPATSQSSIHHRRQSVNKTSTPNTNQITTSYALNRSDVVSVGVYVCEVMKIPGDSSGEVSREMGALALASFVCRGAVAAVVVSEVLSRASAHEIRISLALTPPLCGRLNGC